MLLRIITILQFSCWSYTRIFSYKFVSQHSLGPTHFNLGQISKNIDWTPEEKRNNW